MIKIIEHGTIRKQKCQHCGCLSSYENEDIKHGTNFALITSYSCGYDYIICPQCKEKIQLGGLDD